MRHARAIGRLGGLAVGLGVGTVLAATSGTASAQPDIDISIGGVDLFHLGTATAESGTNDIAIAIGAGSFADAGAPGNPGQFDMAFADGNGAQASAVFGNFDSAFANGDSSSAGAGGGGSLTNVSNGDFASVFGPNSQAEAGAITGMAPASNNDVAMVFDTVGTHGSIADAGNGSFDFASVFGDHDFAEAGLPGSHDLAEIFGSVLEAFVHGDMFSTIMTGPF